MFYFLKNIINNSKEENKSKYIDLEKIKEDIKNILGVDNFKNN